MKNDFSLIPDIVFELFDQIMYQTPSQPRPKGFKCSDLPAAQVIAWGWDPPLIHPGSETRLTWHGLAAHSWRCCVAKKGPSLSDRMLAELTPQQRAIMEHLMMHRSASFDALCEVPGAWNTGIPTDDAIIKKMKEARTRLERAGIWDVEINISTASRRVTVTINEGTK